MDTGPWNLDTLTITITPGTYQGEFYYYDTKVGTPTITAVESPDQGWTDAQQTEMIDPDVPAYITFITIAQTLNAGIASSLMTVQTYDQFDNISPVTADTTLDLFTTSTGGTFAPSDTGPWTP